MKKKLPFILGLAGFMIFSYWAVDQNYKKHTQIKRQLVEHPEYLPKPEVAKRTTFGFSNARADVYWLQTIQYIGGNAISSEYKRYLYVILDLVTTLNPYFAHPYIIGMLLLPGDNEMNENFKEEELQEYTQQAVRIGLKGIEAFCDPIKLERIFKENDLQTIWKNEKYINPCKDDMIPYGLAFVYYYYLHEPLEAAKYYKVASAIEESLGGAKQMAAIMQGKGGEREKSIYMLLSMGKTMERDEACVILSTEIEGIMEELRKEEIELSGGLIQAIGVARTQAFGVFSNDTKEIAMSDTSCQNYANKAIRELNLLYLEHANDIYKKDHDGISATDSTELLIGGYIDYEPVDFQQYEDYGIAYKYNELTGNFDYGNELH